MSLPNNSDHYLAKIDMEEIGTENAFSFFEKSVILLQDIKNEVINKGFANESEEIHFFKMVKPSLLANILFSREVYKIEINAPVKNPKLLMDYYTSCLNDNYAQFKLMFQSSDFYNYWRINSTERDREFFLRKNFKLINCFQTFIDEFDPVFSTHYDKLIARYLSNEMINDFLDMRLDSIENKDMANSFGMKWNRSKSNLVELIYALHGTNCFTEMSIQKLVRSFEKSFNIDISDAYHVFHRMKERTKSRTLFLDELRDTLEQTMNKSDL